MWGLVVEIFWGFDGKDDGRRDWVRIYIDKVYGLEINRGWGRVGERGFKRFDGYWLLLIRGKKSLSNLILRIILYNRDVFWFGIEFLGSFLDIFCK